MIYFRFAFFLAGARFAFVEDFFAPLDLRGLEATFALARLAAGFLAGFFASRLAGFFAGFFAPGLAAFRDIGLEALDFISAL